MRKLLATLGAPTHGSEEEVIKRLEELDADANTPLLNRYVLLKSYYGPFYQYNHTGNSDVPTVITMSTDREVLARAMLDDLDEERDELESDEYNSEHLNELAEVDSDSVVKRLLDYNFCSPTKYYRYDIVELEY